MITLELSVFCVQYSILTWADVLHQQRGIIARCARHMARSEQVQCNTIHINPKEWCSLRIAQTRRKRSPPPILSCVIEGRGGALPASANAVARKRRRRHRRVYRCVGIEEE